MKLIGEHEIYRPGSKLVGIEGTREMYHFMEANTPNNDAATTTDGLQDVELVLKRERGGRLSHREKERFTELGEFKVMTERAGWNEVGAENLANLRDPERGRFFHPSVSHRDFFSDVAYEHVMFAGAVCLACVPPLPKFYSPDRAWPDSAPPVSTPSTLVEWE